jgi:hypothetical protein
MAVLQCSRRLAGTVRRGLCATMGAKMRVWSLSVALRHSSSTLMVDDETPDSVCARAAAVKFFLRCAGLYREWRGLAVRVVARVCMSRMSF